MTRKEEEHYHKFCIQVLEFISNPDDGKREELRARAAKGKLYFEAKWKLEPVLNPRKKDG